MPLTFSFLWFVPTISLLICSINCCTCLCFPICCGWLVGITSGKLNEEGTSLNAVSTPLLHPLTDKSKILSGYLPYFLTSTVMLQNVFSLQHCDSQWLGRPTRCSEWRLLLRFYILMPWQPTNCFSRTSVELFQKWFNWLADGLLHNWGCCCNGSCHFICQSQCRYVGGIQRLQFSVCVLW